MTKSPTPFRSLTSLVAAVTIIGTTALALAQPAAATPKVASQTAVKPEMVDAEVKKIDKDARKITLKHGPIKSLDMPAMTMVFQIKDGAMPTDLKVGDKVKAAFEQTKSGYLVTVIEAAK